MFFLLYPASSSSPDESSNILVTADQPDHSPILKLEKSELAEPFTSINTAYLHMYITVRAF